MSTLAVVEEILRETSVPMSVREIVERAGARLLLLCTNTMHKVAAEIEAAVSIPLLHLADVTAARIKHAGFRRVGFLGSRYAMEQDFYIGRLMRQHLTVCTPAAADRDMIDHVIFDELCNGIEEDRKSTRLNSSHSGESRMPSSA